MKKIQPKIFLIENHMQCTVWNFHYFSITQIFFVKSILRTFEVAFNFSELKNSAFWETRHSQTLISRKI